MSVHIMYSYSISVRSLTLPSSRKYTSTSWLYGILVCLLQRKIVSEEKDGIGVCLEPGEAQQGVEML